VYEPLASVFTTRCWPVARLVTVTVAPEITPPEGSVTVPVSPPAALPCARVRGTQANSATSETNNAQDDADRAVASHIICNAGNLTDMAHPFPSRRPGGQVAFSYYPLIGFVNVKTLMSSILLAEIQWDHTCLACPCGLVFDVEPQWNQDRGKQR